MEPEVIITVPYEVWVEIGKHRTPGYEYDSSRAEHNSDGTVSFPLKVSTAAMLKTLNEDYHLALRKLFNLPLN